MTSSNRYTACFVLCLAFCALGRAQAQTNMWMTVGSDGTVDEADIRKVFFDRSIVQMGRPIAPPTPGAAAGNPAAVPGQIQSAVIRYNIPPINGLFSLRLRYLDAGPGGRVVAKLKEVDWASGSEIDRVTFDSNAFAPAAKYQVRGTDCSSQSFNFGQKGYYIEATLTASAIAAGSAAGIQIIQVGGCLH